MDILFVCRGNTARSQIAEALFRSFPKNSCHRASSVGTKVENPEQLVGERSVTEHLIECMNELHFDIRDNERTQITPEMVERADKIIVMAEPETLPEYLRESDKVEHWDVPDPKKKPYEEHRRVRDVIMERVKILTEGLSD